MIYFIYGREHTTLGGSQGPEYTEYKGEVNNMAKKKQNTEVVVQKVVGKVKATEYIAEYGYPVLGAFEEDKALKKFYKQLPTEVLEDWSSKLGATYKECPDNDSIHRMRVAMSILYTYFPKETKGKAKSKYSSYTLEDLVNLALDNSVAVEDTDDMKIMRMRLIMGLRANKVIE